MVFEFTTSVLTISKQIVSLTAVTKEAAAFPGFFNKRTRRTTHQTLEAFKDILRGQKMLIRYIFHSSSFLSDQFKNVKFNIELIINENT